MRVNIKFMVVALSMLTALVVGLGIHADATTIDRTRDCDKFAVIRCGTMTANELRAEYDSLNTNRSNGSTVRQSDIPAIFTALDVKRSDLNGNFVKGVVYKDGTVRVNGKIVARDAQTAIRNISGGTSIKGSSTAKLVPTSRMGTAQEALVKLNSKGQFMLAVMTPCGNPVKARNVVPEPPKPKPKPVYECKDLTATPRQVRVNEDVRFNTSVTATNGATVRNYAYNFGDGTTRTTTTASTTHKYTRPGTFTARVTPSFNVEGAVKTHTSNACTVKIEVKAKPVYECKDLTATPRQVKLNEEVRFNTAVTATGGATVRNYAYNFGDGTTRTTTTSNTTHRYTTPGTYTARVTPSFNVEGTTRTHTSNACTVKIEVKSNPGVKITKKVNEVDHIITDVNKPFVYTLVVTNRGDIDLKNVKVTDTPEAGVTLRSADRGTITGNTWNYTIPELKVGQSMTFKLTAVVTKYQKDKIVNTACVDAPEVPGNPDDCDKATVEVKPKACNTETGVIETVNPGQENQPPYTTDLSKCDKVKVCDTKTMLITTVTKHEAETNDRYAPVDSEKCKVKVCDPDTGKIIQVPKEDEDKYEPVDSDKCKVKVCDPSTGDIITVPKEDEGDYAPVDSDDCKEDEPEEPETPKTPPALPKSGASDILQGILGLGTLTAASAYYIASRRS